MSLLNDLKCVSGKQNLLFELADATLENQHKVADAQGCFDCRVESAHTPVGGAACEEREQQGCDAHFVCAGEEAKQRNGWL